MEQTLLEEQVEHPVMATLQATQALFLRTMLAPVQVVQTVRELHAVQAAVNPTEHNSQP